MADRATEQTGTVAAALAQAARMLGSRPDLAEAQAREILLVVPGHPQALLLLGTSRRMQGDTPGARAILEPLSVAQPRAPDVHFELGLSFSAAGETRKAIAALSRAVALNDKHVHAWRALGDEKTLAGDVKGADSAYARHIQASVNDPKLLEAAGALVDNRLAVAERLLRTFLIENPTDVSAMRMLAEVGSRLGRYDDAESLLARALELAPGFAAARHNYASVLYRQNKPAETLAQVDMLLKSDPRNPGYRTLKAAALSQAGDAQKSAAAYGSLLEEFPGQPKSWTSYGHALKTLGKTAEGVDAYRKAIAMLPSLGEAYWSLANLKTFRFSTEDVDAMRTQIARSDLDSEDRFHLHFALGKAMEDIGEYAQSFEHYEKGNALRRATLHYSADENAAKMHRMKTVFTPDFLRTRSGAGCASPDPIFIVGLPRSGSTLLEQILSSHSQVEGTMELQDIASIARRLGGRKRTADASLYPEVLQTVPLEEFKALGEEYLSRTLVHRKLNRPFFIDKMPNNFAHAGFIHLILPGAKIIDARRHPLGCCLSGFKQHFARGQAFTYGLEDIGRYYADYVELMAHYDAVLPGRVHRVLYESMVADPEGETRRLLDYCGLPFEDGCLRFYENDRAVRTASSEQVRRPIFSDAVEHWQNFEPWLGTLKSALGPVLDSYPFTPTF